MKVSGSLCDDLLPTGVPLVEAVEQRPGPESGDKAVDTDDGNEDTVSSGQRRLRAAEPHAEASRPCQALALQTDHQYLRDAEKEAHREIEVIGRHRQENGQR